MPWGSVGCLALPCAACGAQTCGSGVPVPRVVLSTACFAGCTNRVEKRPPELGSTRDLRQGLNSRFHWTKASELALCALQPRGFSAFTLLLRQMLLPKRGLRTLSHFNILKWKGHNNNMKESSWGGTYKLKTKVYVCVYIYIFIIAVSKWPCVFFSHFCLYLCVTVLQSLQNVLPLPVKNCESQQKCYKNI